MKKILILAATALASLAAATAAHATGKAPIKLTVTSPGVHHTTRGLDGGVQTRRYKNRRGALATTQWALSLRAEARNAVGFVQKFALGQNREALVLDDPDGCLHLASLMADMTPPIDVFDFNCAGLTEDELYLQVQPERHDIFDSTDNSNDGNDAIRARLVDDSCNSTAPRNVACLFKQSGSGYSVVGPNTGKDLSDGYGYGADDDYAGLVLMADIGAARVFDRDTFDLTPGIIRNMAGLTQAVSTELRTGRGRSAVMSYQHAIGAIFEPIAIFDFSITNPDFGGANAAVRVDSGDIVPFTYVNAFPEFAADGPNNNPFYEELLEQIYPVRTTVRAVLVAGEAPDYIEDLNGDGIYSAADVAMMPGVEVISNQVEIDLRLFHDHLLSDSNDPECPQKRTVLYRDLDGNGDDGAVFRTGPEAGLPLDCIGTSGATRTRRVPD